MIIKGKAYYNMPIYETISDLFEQSRKKHRNDYVLTYRKKPEAEPINFTYQAIADQIIFLQSVWSDLGLTNRRLALSGRNSYPWITIYLAAVESQNMVIPLDNLLTVGEQSQLIHRAKANIYCVDGLTLIKYAGNLSYLQDLTLIMIMNDYHMTENEIAQLTAIKSQLPDVIFIDFSTALIFGEELVNQGIEAKFNPVAPDDPSILIFTSGTTAMAKGVLLSQRAIVTDVAALHGMINFPERCRSLSILPLNHTFESTCGFLGVLSIGGHIHICDGLRYAQKNLQEYSIQMFIGVPAIFDSMYRRIINYATKQGKMKKINMSLYLSKFLRFFKIDKRRKLFDEVLSQLGYLEIVICGAAPMKKEQIEFFHNMGIRIYEGYGLTETSPVVTGNNDFTFIPGTVGEPVPGVEIKIESEEPNVPGEILIKGPILMQGYYDNPEETAAVFTEDGWFRSGDLGIVDTKTNSLRIIGRKKSMIVLNSGKKVYPEEIEQLIKENGPDVITDTLIFAQNTENMHKILSAKFVLDIEKTKEGALKSGFLTDVSRYVTDLLDKLLKDINSKMPDFKRIKTYFYSYKNMISTSTLKVKRDAEESQLEKMKQKLNLRWYEISKKNIDLVEAEFLELL